ncbi:M23 family metallopeptidase [Streptomyces sp. OR43]|uniref:M23 family metallopeptidase n=1 Tax=Streptomyces sp. or43 TaxID=2478957 RepID=UPI0011CD9EC6|nr:M23 family metallopeptidase [Streptomyces sp. or43]TXS36763.1 M23 family metallopeptidase [Streptomyces sp. or43]
MELEERVSELERRLEALVGERPDAPSPTGADFWALDGLKQQLEGAGEAGGGVLYTGAVRLPTGERYEWQFGALTEQPQPHRVTECGERQSDAGVGAGKGGGVQGGPSRPKFRYLWPVVRRNQHFPAFGSPLLAVADGTVVYASHGRRDHLSRDSGPALMYLMLIEASVRDVLGPGAIVGNHLVLDLGDGTYAMYAHLRRGSLRVRVGEEVRAGQMLAECGNSGNSTEPHVHFQLMDDPDLDVAVGIPFTWRGIGLPANGEVFTVGDAVGRHPVPVPDSGTVRAV